MEYSLAKAAASTIEAMAQPDDADFDRWVTEQGGPEAVAAMVADARHQVEEGMLPSFTDRDEFLAYLRRRDRRLA